MPIRPFLPGSHSFDPEDIAKMSAAALRKLGLADRTDPATMAVAKLIIEFAKAGERDPERLCVLALPGVIKVTTAGTASASTVFSSRSPRVRVAPQNPHEGSGSLHAKMFS